MIGKTEKLNEYSKSNGIQENCIQLNILSLIKMVFSSENVVIVNQLIEGR